MSVCNTALVNDTITLVVLVELRMVWLVSIFANSDTNPSI
jgi:hypothetical protein